MGGRLLSGEELTITHLLYDSRRIQQPSSSLFFALKSGRNNGHHYLPDAYEKGVRAFVVSEAVQLPEDALIIEVADTLIALQALAAYHRSQFDLPVIGITGSNGKTVVKEWLNQLLEEDYSIAKSPKSFNSQIGVPLSVWDLAPQHTLAIFEAGISTSGEMEKLQKIIRPTIGVLTNLGAAHSEGFSSDAEKLREKLRLFAEAEVVIGPHNLLQNVPQPTFTWSRKANADVMIRSVQTIGTNAVIDAQHEQKNISISIPFTDEASVENAITCLCVLLYLQKEPNHFVGRFQKLHPVDMRLQLHGAINDCLLINDSYSADLNSLNIALHFLAEQSAGRKRTVILSDFFESGKKAAALYSDIARMLQRNGVQKVYAIGEKITASLPGLIASTIEVQCYADTGDFITQFRSSQFANEVILLKGARAFGFEKIAALFEQKLHGTVLQINLTALSNNLKEYQKHLRSGTKIMAMVKAFSYGSGGAEIASVLQFHKVAYLGVAYADEGVELVQAGITLPIMVINPEAASFSTIIEHNLQPVIYSLQLLRAFEEYVKTQGLIHYPVHLEVETGMNRLGFPVEEMELAASHLAQNNTLTVQSLFSHLAASEDRAQDAFTEQQSNRFHQAASILQTHLGYSFLKHVANTAAIIRHPQLQLDMVRLGIGLYGIASDAEEVMQLEPVATLRSTIAQIKTVRKGESVSYNRRGVVQRDSRIATVRIGYADGYSRRFSNGVGKMWVKGQPALVIGTVCMDMTMIDVTDLEGVQEGDDVIVFGKEISVEEMARWIGTIPYEVMTSVQRRVKRVYYYES
jgi:alanine racemase